MPVHDWTRVEAGIFHDFHHAWIEEIKRSLNSGVLPSSYYAMAEQHAAGFGPDVLTLQETGSVSESEGDYDPSPPAGDGGLLVAAPKARLIGETDMEFYRRKQKGIAVRHVSGDRIVAFVEVVSPGNKSTSHAMRAFVDKAAELLDRQIHLLILDLHPPGPRDPQGIHGLIWDAIAGQPYTAPADKPLTLAAYESAVAIRAYVEHIAVGESNPEMPLFLEPGGHVSVPLEATYQSAFTALPRRWQIVLERSRAGRRPSG